MNRRGSLTLTLVLAAGLTVAQAGVNSSVKVDAGEVVNDDVSTVNGQIRIGDGATVNGEVESVNGPVHVGRDARLESLSSVNGGIGVEDGTVIDGPVSAVNGPISLDGARAARVSTVNGPIELAGTEVEGDLSTYNGDITLTDGSQVGGDLVIKEPNRGSNSHRSRPLKITIEDGSVVSGDLIVEDEDLEVEVYLRGGTVEGRIEGAEVIEK